MNVLIITREIPPVGGGAGHVAIHLAQQLAELGHSLDIVTMGFGDLPAKKQRGNITIHRVDCGRKNQDSSYLLEMLRFVRRARPLALEIAKKNNCEIIHAHAIIPDGLIARQVAKHTGAKYFITAHGSDVPGYNPDKFSLAHKAMAPFWHKSLRDAAAVITPSTHLANLIRKARPEQDIKVIPNGILLDTFDAGEQVRTDTYLIVSRLVKRKNYHLFLEALGKIDSPQTVHIVGKGPMLGELKTLASTMSQHAITFHGWLTNGSTDWKNLYQTCKYFVFPSESENFPINLLEAQLAGLVVLASDIPGNREVLGEHAIYFHELSSASIAETLIEVRSWNQSQLDELTDAGAKRVRNNFGWPHIAQRYLEAFEGDAIPSSRIDPTRYDWQQDNYYLIKHHRLQLMGAVIRKFAPKRVLDVGCGMGQLASLLDKETQYFGCDAREDKQLASEHLLTGWKYAKETGLPFAAERFGAIVCSGFIEYIDDHDVLFKQVHDALEENGLFIASAINPRRLRIRMHELGIPGGFRHPAWRNLEPWPQLGETLGRAGFELAGFLPVRRGIPARLTAPRKLVERMAAVPPSEAQLNSKWISQAIFICRKISP